VNALGLFAGVLVLAAPPSAPPAYTVARTRAESAALLAGDAGAWKGADRIHWGPSANDTAFAALWDADALFLRWEAVDAAPWHTMTHRDDHLWEEEVVEVFLDLDRSGRDYAELEISPANVVCDVRMVSAWPQKKGDLAWNMEGLETRVAPLHDAAGATVGWTALARLPWSGFRTLGSAAHAALPPQAGDRWRFNVFRIKRPGGKEHPEKDAIEAAWSDPGGPSFHVPAAFRDFVFAPGQ
jgi:hypothetical protein